MLPSLLARDIQTGVKQFLVTAFEPSDNFFRGLVQRFVDDEPRWTKGPFLQLELPFREVKRVVSAVASARGGTAVDGPAPSICVTAPRVADAAEQRVASKGIETRVKSPSIRSLPLPG